ncbi:hypothetical protein HMPREF0208_03646 [Citrobacter koseri]|nr:hypothetical protein HMPREF3207_04890 [Citrobacter koseri]KWZ98268.1 hypothetical protein HMPREF3220_02684 [Citrobacter koseri]KXB41498.1 hypothetical protein HMPREF0208_03646 [Citrobacter koseri]
MIIRQKKASRETGLFLWPSVRIVGQIRRSRHPALIARWRFAYRADKNIPD